MFGGIRVAGITEPMPVDNLVLIKDSYCMAMLPYLRSK